LDLGFVDEKYLYEMLLDRGKKEAYVELKNQVDNV